MLWPSLGSQAARCQFVSYPCSAALEGLLSSVVSIAAAPRRCVGLCGPAAPRAGSGQGGGRGQRDCRIPTLLDLLAIAGVIATIGCQRGIAPTILNKIAGYVLALEGN